MLSKVVIKNFKSINDLSLDFSFAQKRYIKDRDLIDVLYATDSSKKENKNRLVAVANIYGANASGKTNIVEAMQFFSLIIKKGLKKVPYSPNKLIDSKGDIFMQFVFFVNQKEFTYELSYDSVSIKNETLLCDGVLLYSIINSKINFKGIVIDDFNEEYLCKQFKVGCVTTEGSQVNTFLAFIVDKLPSLSKELVDVFNFFNNNFVVSMSNKMNVLLAVERLAQSNEKKDINCAIRKITNIIRNIDIDIDRFDWIEEQGDLNLIKKEDGYDFSRFTKGRSNKFGVNVKISQGDNKYLAASIRSYHKNIKNQDIEFDLEEESKGTYLAFALIGFILSFFETGGVLVVDEFDASLHPLVLLTLIKMFKNKKYNKKCAQLILTLHTTDVLEDDFFKISDFYFVNKNKKRGTFITRLSDFENTRNEMNFRDRYLRGDYFGIPYTFN